MFLEKSEMFLIIYDLSHLKIVHACVQLVSIQGRHAKDQCTCMSTLKNTRYFVETKVLQTVRQTVGHSDDHRENMTSHTKVWRGIKGWFRSVPQSTNSQGCLVFCGTERNKKMKDGFLGKSEIFLINYNCSHLNIVYVCVLPVSIQARGAKVCQI